MKNDSRIISNDVIIHETNNISVNMQIKMIKFHNRLKIIYEKLYSSYPDIEITENISIIYKKYNKEFKEISSSIKNFYDHKSVVDFISQVEPSDDICWFANVYDNLKINIELWISNVENMLYNIFLYKLNDNE